LLSYYSEDIDSADRVTREVLSKMLKSAYKIKSSNEYRLHFIEKGKNIIKISYFEEDLLITRE
jgi:hypothetical protein